MPAKRKEVSSGAAQGSPKVRKTPSRSAKTPRARSRTPAKKTSAKKTPAKRSRSKSPTGSSRKKTVKRSRSKTPSKTPTRNPRPGSRKSTRKKTPSSKSTAAATSPKKSPARAKKSTSQKTPAKKATAKKSPAPSKKATPATRRTPARAAKTAAAEKAAAEGVTRSSSRGRERAPSPARPLRRLSAASDEDEDRGLLSLIEKVAVWCLVITVLVNSPLKDIPLPKDPFALAQSVTVSLVAAGITSLLVAWIIEFLERANCEAFSGKASVVESLKNSAGALMNKPYFISYYTSARFFHTWLFVAVIFANDTLKEALGAHVDWDVIQVILYIVTKLAIDRDNCINSSTKRRSAIPFESYCAWIIQYVALFSLRGWVKAFLNDVCGCPSCLAQVVVMSCILQLLHLLGNDLYNNNKSDSLSRFARIGKHIIPAVILSSAAFMTMHIAQGKHDSISVNVHKAVHDLVKENPVFGVGFDLLKSATAVVTSSLGL